MASQFTIKRLTGTDLGQMRALNALYAAVFEMPDEYLGKPPGDEWLVQLLGRDDFISTIAMTPDGQIIGGLSGYLLVKFEQARREIYIYDLAVAPDWRRQGVASALINHLRAEAARLKAWVIFVQADEGDNPAIGLYRKWAAGEEIAHHFDIEPKSGD